MSKKTERTQPVIWSGLDWAHNNVSWQMSLSQKNVSTPRMKLTNAMVKTCD